MNFNRFSQVFKTGKKHKTKHDTETNQTGKQQIEQANRQQKTANTKTNTTPNNRKQATENSKPNRQTGNRRQQTQKKTQTGKQANRQQKTSKQATEQNKQAHRLQGFG
jgi:hypothetical protein